MKSKSFLNLIQLETEATRLRVDKKCRMVSVVLNGDTWMLFYEENVSQPIITKHNAKNNWDGVGL